MTADGDALAEGLVFRSLRADLFAKTATSLIDDVKLSNSELQRVLRRLLMSKEQRGKDRGFISYAELGINQLGAVYEGLMSYTGFFAHERLYEVAKNGDPEKGSWVVPEARIEGISKSDFVTEVDEETGERRPVAYDRGEFVYRLAGRERQQSASYYTPEVLTRFTVGQALEELLDQDGTTTTAAEILELTVCEPALGSGAFAIEAVRQLAEQYLARRQRELDQRIDPDMYAEELQKVKAHIALHQVYGVDLNATAVEFAEISLWLDTMGKGLNAPWFGLHLRRGNSLIGARRAVIPARQISDAGWITAMPVDVAMSASFDDHPNAVHHFLLPANGWGSTADAKEAKNLAKDQAAALNAWRKSLKKKLTAAQLKQLRALALRVEELWALSAKRVEIAESQVRRDIPLWGVPFTPTGGEVTREEIEASLADIERPYQRLRRAMDAWCAMWFWPLTGTARTVDGVLVDPPNLDEWIAGLTALLGTYLDRSKKRGAKQTGADLFQGSDWEGLNDADDNDRVLSKAEKIDDVLTAHPWFVVAERVAKQQGFFHWELDFSSVFVRDGFDLQVGNPPWVRPTVDINALLAETDPWFQLAAKPRQSVVRARTEATLALPGTFEFVVDQAGDTSAVGAYLRDAKQFPHLGGLQPDLYRCFMEQVWRHAAARGVAALIHPETHFTDDKASMLRRATYARLRRHWQFINELKLYEIHHLVSYGVHVYGAQQQTNFLHATSLYHPDTVVRSFNWDPLAPEPGLKDAAGNWDVRPHPDRISRITPSELTTWRNLLEDEAVPPTETRMIYSVNKSSDSVLTKLSTSIRIAELRPQFSSGWHEKSDRSRGYFDVEWGAPDSWNEVILQGPHFHVATPFNKTPNSTMKNNLDWSPVDLETLAPDAIPATSYKPIGSIDRYNADYTSWDVPDENGIVRNVRARDEYRIAWRMMAASTGERTLISILLPVGSAHIHGISAIALPDAHSLLPSTGAILCSIVADFIVRAVPKAVISAGAVGKIPRICQRQNLDDALSIRYLRLVAVTRAYSSMWASRWSSAWTAERWTCSGLDQPLGQVAPQWSPDTPLRRDIDRRQALVEIDALVALGLGLTADELCTIYRTQFPVLYGYDRNKYLYDANGRIVPQEVLSVWKKKGDGISQDERTATNASGNTYVYELPFNFLDREADMRHAYEVFEQRLAKKDD
ncbi:MAG: class I SAM-dependent DNA methyltransferase [Gordonia sp. (in: high G+C Gram-positive bacteria)]